MNIKTSNKPKRIVDVFGKIAPLASETQEEKFYPLKTKKKILKEGESRLHLAFVC
jgi:hypothetical protein